MHMEPSWSPVPLCSPGMFLQTDSSTLTRNRGVPNPSLIPNHT